MKNGYSVAAGTDILIFRTNIRFKKDLRQVSPALNNEPRIRRWNVDREDSDKVLRIESGSLKVQDVIDLINRAGYFCEELPE